MGGWLDGLMDGRVGSWWACRSENRSMFHGNHSRALFALLRFYFRCNNGIARKKKLKKNNAVKLKTEKRPGLRKY